jgi:hypothetical protein
MENLLPFEVSALTKTSPENEIKTYFRKVLELKQSGREFPVNLDEVWPVVYSTKGNAKAELLKNYVEGDDFNLMQNNKVVKSSELINGIEYTINLSVSCLEYFIVRKVRPVFEVYRQVFHRVAEQKPLSQAELLLQSAQILLEQERRVAAIETKVDALVKYQEQAQAELDFVPVSTRPVKELSVRDNIRMIVNQYSKATGIMQQFVWDKIYSELSYRYHINIKSCDKHKNESWLDVAARRGCIQEIYDVASELITKIK